MSEPVQVALITGGEGDLARELAAQLRASGWKVHAPGHTALDVTDSDAVTKYIGSLPALDLLINNAGCVADATVWKMSAAEFSTVLDVNLKGAFRASRAAMKIMSKRRRGHIVNVGSFAALAGTAGQANYAAAKAGLIGFTQSIAREYGARGVRCNCVLPGFLETRMTQGLPASKLAEVMAQHALRDLNTVADAARFIVQLDAFQHISGQVFQLDSRICAWT